MRIALITANQSRHKYLANVLLSEFGENFVGIVSQNLESAKIVRQSRFLQPGFLFLKDPVMFYYIIVSKFKKFFFPKKRYFFIDGKSPQFPAQVPVHFTTNINSAEAVCFLQDCKPDIILVLGGKILGADILKIPQHTINLHFGFCPLYKGSGSVITAAGRSDFKHMAATIHFIDAGVDTGDIIGYVYPKYEYYDDPEDVLNKTIIAGIDELVKIVKKIISNQPVNRIRQPKFGKTYFSKSEEKLALDRQGKKNIYGGDFKRFLLNTGQIVLPRYSFARISIKLMDFLRSKLKADRFRDGVYIFLYHHVSKNLQQDCREFGSLGINKISTDEKKFKEHLNFLKKHFNFISLDAGVGMLRDQSGPIRGRYAVITFDDGYKSVRDVAFPILRDLNIPFAIFVNGNPLIEHKGLTRMRLSSLLQISGDLFIESFNKEFCKKFQTPTQIFAEFKDNFCLAYENFIHNFWDREAGKDVKNVELNFYLNLDDVKFLKNEGVTIGSHTYCHPMLSKLGANEQNHEIVEWHRQLGGILEEKLKYFAYPFGGVNHFNAQSELFVLEMGDVCALSAYGFVNKNYFPTDILRIQVNNQTINQLRLAINASE